MYYEKIGHFSVSKVNQQTVKGGEETTSVPPAVADEEDIDRSSGRPKTNGKVKKW